jgi:putative zinc finger/helix-turn-helix YgiT family protein
MEQRAFSRKCGKCRQQAVEIAIIPYDVQVDHDGRKYNVSIPSLSVPKCGNCGDISIDDEADKQIDTAFRKVAGLLTPEEIRAGHEACGLNQQRFADVLGIASSTLSRWENGAQVQQRSLDRLMRAFFDVPALREYLMRPRGLGKTIQRATQPPLTTVKTTATSTLPVDPASYPFPYTNAANTTAPLLTTVVTGVIAGSQ